MEASMAETDMGLSFFPPPPAAEEEDEDAPVGALEDIDVELED
jgi:hypothetical protein